ncbi:hypothetical protein GUJ93_ZPchr0008g12690 [Zizania palustris]|uniref:Uncharacterized protein n=1 Tax=Zizania palustris TaxID=103762 RepID=A0A8J5V5A8_ZIZPA|nr:hypothetical protein GUJ93_ZPchr0008g12690 [Zizania palustris]
MAISERLRDGRGLASVPVGDERLDPPWMGDGSIGPDDMSQELQNAFGIGRKVLVGVRGEVEMGEAVMAEDGVVDNGGGELVSGMGVTLGGHVGGTVDGMVLGLAVEDEIAPALGEMIGNVEDVKGGIW